MDATNGTASVREDLLTTDQRGVVAEAAIVQAAARLGIGVSRPLGAERYDLVFDLRSRLLRVQCKWATLAGDVVTVRCTSSRRTKNGLSKRPYGATEIDGIAAYCSALDRSFFLPMPWADMRTQVSLHVGPTRNGQRVRVNSAESFAFERLRCGLPGP